MFSNNLNYQKDIEKVVQEQLAWNKLKNKSILIIGA